MAGEARIHVLAHPLDRASLTGGIATLEEQQHSLAMCARPVLHLDQFDLEDEQSGRVLAAAEPFRLREDRVAPLINGELPYKFRVEVVHGCLRGVGRALTSLRHRAARWPRSRSARTLVDTCVSRTHEQRLTVDTAAVTCRPTGSSAAWLAHLLWEPHELSAVLTPPPPADMRPLVERKAPCYAVSASVAESALEPGVGGYVRPCRSVRPESWQNKRRAGNMRPCLLRRVRLTHQAFHEARPGCFFVESDAG